jgi:5'-phosphate synthase pdxT subunit
VNAFEPGSGATWRASSNRPHHGRGHGGGWHNSRPSPSERVEGVETGDRLNGAVALPVTVGVLALQGDVREHLAMLAALGVSAVEVRSATDLALVDALILPGGESTTMSLLIESTGLLPEIGDRLAGGMPAFGTCAGMILLATDVADGRPDQHFFGAIDIGVRRNAFGRQIDSFETDLAVTGLDTPLHAVFIRAPVVERVGPGVEVLAAVDGFDGRTRPVVARQGAVLVAAFHPELANDARLHRLFLSMVTEAVHGGGGHGGGGHGGGGHGEGGYEARTGEQER